MSKPASAKAGPAPAPDAGAGVAANSNAASPGMKVVPIGSARKPVAPTVIAVTSGKGGVGKTNVAVNLAIAYAQRGARVLCVDADLGLANMDILMGVAPTKTTADLVEGSATVDEVLVEGPHGVWLLPGASGRYDVANLSDQQRLAFFAAIDGLDDRFDIVIVDTGAGIGSNAIGFASAAKDIVLVVTPEPTSVADAYGMLKVLSTKCAVRRVHVLTSMARTTSDANQVFRRLQALADRFLQIQLDPLGAIPADDAVARSVMRGEPYLVAYPQSQSAEAIARIADTLADQDDIDDRQGAIRLFWRKLLRQGGA